MLRDKAKCKGSQRKACASSRNNKAWQHSAGTSKQLPKSKAQITLGQLASTSIHLQAKQTRHSPHKHKETLKSKTKALHATPPEGKANTKHTHTMKQCLDSGVIRLFWVNWNKSEKGQIYDYW